MTESRLLYERIIKSDYCIGCGICASINDSPFEMHMNDYGNIVAAPITDLDKNGTRVLTICPFSGHSKNEDEISDIYFKDIETKDSKAGRYLECFAGYVTEGAFRERGSSGGFAKWLGYTLLKEGEIDYFVQVIPNNTNSSNFPLFDYSIISDCEVVINGSKSSYYPVTLDKVINKILSTEARYAITGVPCFIKALRLLSLENEVLKNRIKFAIGIVCGGMKSANHAKIIGLQLGVKPENLIAIDFRRKYKDKPASQKIYQVWSNIDSVERYKNADEIFGTDWGSGYFKPNACDYCDDVVGETADISFGDAWLPQFESDPCGTSLIINRNKKLSDLLNRYKENIKITLYPLKPEDIGKAQEGGFRHRREALSYRIAKKETNGQWYPAKRVKASQFKISNKRKNIYSLREKIASQSHISGLEAIISGDYYVFYRNMNPLRNKYYAANHGSLPVRAVKKLIRIIFQK